jgi:hypothetical protein
LSFCCCRAADRAISARFQPTAGEFTGDWSPFLRLLSPGNLFDGRLVALRGQQAAIHEVISQACHRLGIATQFEPIKHNPKLVPMNQGFMPAEIYSECRATPVGTDPGCGEFRLASRIGFDGLNSAMVSTSKGCIRSEEIQS